MSVHRKRKRENVETVDCSGSPLLCKEYTVENLSDIRWIQQIVFGSKGITVARMAFQKGPCLLCGTLDTNLRVSHPLEWYSNHFDLGWYQCTLAPNLLISCALQYQYVSICNCFIPQKNWKKQIYLNETKKIWITEYVIEQKNGNLYFCYTTEAEAETVFEVKWNLILDQNPQLGMLEEWTENNEITLKLFSQKNNLSIWRYNLWKKLIFNLYYHSSLIKTFQLLFPSFPYDLIRVIVFYVIQIFE